MSVPGCLGNRFNPHGVAYEVSYFAFISVLYASCTCYACKLHRRQRESSHQWRLRSVQRLQFWKKSMKKILFAFISILLITPPMFAAAPVCLYQNVLSGQASGGEGGNGVYVTITGKNLGTSGTVTINGTPVAQTFNWGAADVTGNYQTVGVQVASGTTSGPIVLTTAGGSASNLSFTVRSGSIWYFGSGIDTTTISSPTCTQLKNDTAPGDVGNGGMGTYADPWKFTNAVNVDTYSTQNNTYTYHTARTPYTYYNCISAGDTIVFLNGFSFIYGDGYNLHSSFNLNQNKGASGTPLILEARPGATVQLGAMGDVAFGIRDDSDTNFTISGISATGSGSTSGSAIAGDASTIGTNPPNERIVGNILTCPDCDGASAVLEAGWDSAHETLTPNTGIEILGNWVYNAGCSDGAGVSDKQYHFIYTNGNGQEIAWNKIGGTGATAGCAQNGIQVNYYKDDGTIGFGNYSIHDNDISNALGSGINLATVDLTAGPVSVYNNVIHHTGTLPASSGGSFFTCIAFPAYGPTAGTGTVNVYNNTLYDCDYYLNTSNIYLVTSGAFYVGSGQSGMVLKLTNNIAYQPTYTYTSSSANLFVSGPGTSIASGNNNLWYTASSCASGCLTIPSATGTVTNPLMVSPSAGNFTLQSSSPAIGAGSASLYPALDFAGNTRPNLPAMGALEYGSASSEVQITVSAVPSPATLEQPVTLTATVAQTGSSVPTGSINFMNGGVSLGQASLDSEGTATLVLSWLSVGSYKVIAAYSGNSNYAAGESGYVPLQVLDTTTTSLVASPNPVTAGQALVLTATVEGVGDTSPAGTVSFLNGSTPLGTATLNASGVATLSTASLAAGTYSLTAQYTGNASFLSSTSAAVPVTVNAQATVIVQSFSLNAGGSTSQTVQSGGTAVYTLGVSPAVGTTLPAINFVVSGLPAGATATFSPQTIPAGNGATNVTLSIQTSVQSAMLERNRKLGGGLVVALGILLLPFGGGIRRSGKSMLRLSYLVLFLAGAVSLAGLTGCAVLNVPGAFPSTSAQTYTVTVTSTAASLSQTTTVTLIVE